jgi:hypothetical protein
MRRAVLWLLRAELTAACHLTTVGVHWAARAARRLGKFSGDYSGGLK